MPLKTSCLRFLLCFIVTVALAGNYHHHHHHHHRNYFRNHLPNRNHHDDYYDPYTPDYLEDYFPRRPDRVHPQQFMFVGNQKSQHNKNQKPCHQLPPGLQGRPESSLPPGQRKKGPPCPAPSFQDSSTQSPSFETAEKLYGSKDFQFKDVQEFIENKPYEIQGYTKDNFPVVLLKKYDIRK